MSQDLAIDLFGPPCLTLVFAGLVWLSDRSITGGRPLTPHMRAMLAYGSALMLGMLYVFSVGATLKLRTPWMVSGVGGWAGLIGYIAWRRHRRRQVASGGVSNGALRRAHLRQGLAVVALLVSLIVNTIEWSFVFGHQGHWLAAMLWSAGVAGSILLAYGNRRTTVIVTLRAYLVLLVIGALAERKTDGLIAAAIGAAVYFVLEKLWKKPKPAVLDLEELSHESDAGSNDPHAATKRR